MNKTTQLLLVGLVLVAAFIGIQQIQPASTSHSHQDDSCAEPGGG